jgi:nucleoside-diphosphate-sugar epimerase
MSKVASRLSGAHALVIGGGGYIGRRLVSKLHSFGAMVTSFDLNPAPVPGAMTCTACDISSDDSVAQAFSRLKDHPFKYVFHLAAQKNIPDSIKDPATTFAINVGGTMRVLAACQKLSTMPHVIFISTYGVGLSDVSSESPYLTSKRMGEMLVRSYFTHGGLPATICRLANVYGPQQSEEGVIPSMLKQMMANVGELRLGNTAARRDFIYIDDVVSGLIAAAIEPGSAGKTLDLGTGKSTSVADVVDIASGLLHFNGKASTEQSRMRSQDSSELVASVEPMQQLCEWKSVVDLEEGLRRVIAAANEGVGRIG